MITISNFCDHRQLNFNDWLYITMLNSLAKLSTFSTRFLSSRGPATAFTPAILLVAASGTSYYFQLPLVSFAISGVTALSGVGRMVGVLLRHRIRFS